MARNKRPQRSNRRRRVVQKPLGRRNWISKKAVATWGYIKWVAKPGWGLVSIAATVIGIAGFVQLFPRINISPESFTDPTKPFTVSFKIENQGYLSLRNLEFTCGLEKGTTEGAIQGLFTGVDIKNSADSVPLLNPSESTETSCRIGQGEMSVFSSIDLMFRAKYEYPLPFLSGEKVQCFSTRRDKDNQIQWLYKTCSTK